MIKETPSFGRMLAMVVFALSCFGILIFLWLSFGGPIPLKPERYRVQVHVPEAATLAQEADVRMAGISIGKIKQKELDKGGATTLVTIDIDPKFAPIPKDSRFILRQKTLLGETYAEITPGTKSDGGSLADGGTIPNAQVEPTVELDEIFSAFDQPTREAFRKWVAESAKAIDGTPQDPDATARALNDALGNLGPFAEDGADVLGVLDRQKADLKTLVRNTGEVFGAISERDHALRNLITNSDQVFEATASRDESLKEMFRIFPTFLDESKATLARLETFSVNARPLARDLRPVAQKLDPTVKDIAAVSPDLKQLFRDLDPLIDVSEASLPDAERFLRATPPVLDGLHNFLQELNPILSYMNYDSRRIQQFLSNGSAATNYRGRLGNNIFLHMLAQIGAINARSFSFSQPDQEGSKRPSFERGNSYIAPQNYLEVGKYGAIQSFTCDNAGGEKLKADPGSGPNRPTGSPFFPGERPPSQPCKVQGPNAWDGNYFPRLTRGKAPNQKAPKDDTQVEGSQPNYYPK